jgi:hypothetical protein
MSEILVKKEIRVISRNYSSFYDNNMLQMAMEDLTRELARTLLQSRGVIRCIPDDEDPEIVNRYVAECFVFTPADLQEYTDRIRRIAINGYPDGWGGVYKKVEER